MKKKWIVLIIIGVVLLGCAKYCVGKYNHLVTLNESVDTAWAQVENVLQRRNDLIPNLVNTVQGYAAHEKKVFIDVTEARAKVGQAQGIPNKVAANNQLTAALGRLLLVVERYPDLKANQNFLDLQAQLEGSENRIAVERRRFNDLARDYNTATRRFPGNMIAGIFGFEKTAYFEAAEGSDQAPKVEF